jgi:hypothetical protein
MYPNRLGKSSLFRPFEPVYMATIALFAAFRHRWGLKPMQMSSLGGMLVWVGRFACPVGPPVGFFDRHIQVKRRIVGEKAAYSVF